ncbi:zf-CHY-domain-containing protein [Hypoxylon sp. FL1284]|nr:zf-CHY-domain-containing protein [Hypoxylon sp. FL1284]
MANLVTDFIVNPVIRQARRFSRSGNQTPSDPTFPSENTREPREGQEDAISETEEDSYLGDEVDASIRSSPSSRSSIHPNPNSDVPDSGGNPGQSSTVNRATLRVSELPIRENAVASTGNQGESVAGGRSSLATGDLRSETNIAVPSKGRRKSLPEDDGMGALRRRIFAIQGQEIGASEKANLMHQLLLEGYTKSRRIAPAERPQTPSSPASSENRPSSGPLESFKFWQNTSDETETREEFDLTPDDIRPTFAPPKDPSDDVDGYAEDTEYSDYQPLGCEHYRRNVKLQCSTCLRWYTCRFCHDKDEDHNLIRKDTRNMLCMFCGTAQRAGEACVSCGASAARYYCSICKLWNDDPDKPVYHCSDCGICRIGRGLGKDFFHCKTCCACIAIGQENDHKCIERSTDCDCPICGDYMFTSPKAVCFMKCGHSIHNQCLDQHMKVAYKCPICNKSLANMELQFRNLDLAIEAQPMPPEFRDTRALVLCNDCSAKSSVKYHWLGLKCGVCSSYNTAQLQILGMNEEAIETDLIGRETQLSGLSASRGTGVAEAGDGTRPRDIRRRHSSNVDRSTIARSPLQPAFPDRFARSVSPSHPSLVWNPPAGYPLVEAEEEEREDMLGFWSRVPRSIASNEEDDEEGSEGEELSSSEEEDGDEGEDDDDIDDFELLGHR